jgi:hypothetical protein
LLLGLAEQTRAGFVTDTLGSAGPGNFAILTLNGAKDIALNGPGTTNGNVGVSDGGVLALNSSNGNPSTAVNGNVFLGNTATINNPKQVTGTVFTNQTPLLNQANTDARNASATFAALAPNLSVPGNAINGTTTINGTAPVNVLNISSLHLGNGQSLTLNGPPGSQFVINNSGNFTLNSGHINLTGGLTPSDVVINQTAPSGDLSTSGGLNNESVVNAILLAPNQGIAFAPGLVNGEVISGGSTVHFVSGASVNMPPVPAPPSMVLMCIGGTAVLGLAARSRRQRIAPVC